MFNIYEIRDDTSGGEGEGWNWKIGSAAKFRDFTKFFKTYIRIL